MQLDHFQDVGDIPVVASELLDASYETQVRHGDHLWTLLLANKLDEAKDYIEAEQYASPFHALGMAAYHGAYGVLRKDSNLLKVLFPSRSINPVPNQTNL